MAVSQHIWHCGAGLPGDVLIADLRAYRYDAHFHDAWSIGAIARGRCAFTVHGRPFEAGEGDLVVIAPGQVHTGGTSAGLLAYRMAYIEPAWFQQHALALREGGLDLPGPVIRDAPLCAQWLAALAPDHTDDAARRGDLSAALFRLLAAHGRAPAEAARDGADVCELLWQRMRADPPARPTWRRWRGPMAATAAPWSSSSRAATVCRRRPGCAIGGWRAPARCCAAGCRWPRRRWRWALPTRRT